MTICRRVLRPPAKPDIAELRRAERAERKRLLRDLGLNPRQYRRWLQFKRRLEETGLCDSG